MLRPLGAHPIHLNRASAMARVAVDLELEQVRVIVRDLDNTLEPVGFARLHGGGGGGSDVYRIDLAGAENPLVLKIYGDEPAWIVAKEALVAGWIGERADLPIPRWLRVDERRTCIPFRSAVGALSKSSGGISRRCPHCPFIASALDRQLAGGRGGPAVFGAREGSRNR